MNMTAIAIVAIIAWAIVSITDSVKTKKSNKTSDKAAEAYQSEIAELKERVSVLEKIVTDEKYDLKKQFADLEKDRVA
jgi:molybdopterin biosynthesis enzyme MoaB